MEQVGWMLAAMSLVAGSLDAVENVALLRTVRSYESASVSNFSPLVTQTAAALKFSILFLAVVYLFVGVGALGVRSLRSSGFRSGRS